MHAEELLGVERSCQLCKQRGTLHPIGAAGLTIRADRVLVVDKRPFEFCRRCWLVLEPALENACRRAQKKLPRRGRPSLKQVRAAFEEALEEGNRFEQALLLLRSRGPGRLPKVAKDLAIHVLFFLGASDAQLGEVLGVSAEHVKHRRQRSTLHIQEWMRIYLSAE
jgi:hypothetical protein